MRHREKGGFTVGYSTTQNCSSGCTTGCPNGQSSWSASLNNTSALSGTFETMDDVVTPRYKERSGKGEVIVNPYIKSSTTRGFSASGLSWRCKCATNPDTWTVYTHNSPNAFSFLGNAPVISIIDSATRSSLRNQACTAAWADVESSDASLLVDLAEADKTLQMFRKPLGDLSSLLDSIDGHRKHSRFGRALSLGQYIANGWLQYRFGILPLLNTINGTAQALGRVGKVRPPRRTARGKSVYSSSRQIVNPESYAAGMYVATTDSVVHTLNIRAGILYESSSSLSKDLGLTAKDIPNAIWDLVPYSFVIDRFVNIADALRGLIMYGTVSPLASWVVEEDTFTTNRTISSVRPNTSACTGYSILTPPSGSSYVVQKVRTRSIGVDAPSIGLQTGQISAALKTKWCVDYLGLLIQRLRP